VEPERSRGTATGEKAFVGGYAELSPVQCERDDVKKLM